MRKGLVAAAFLVAVICGFTGIGNVEVQAITDIDMSVSVQPGMRVAVVSKSKKGQFWSMVRQGMEAGIEAINASYQLKKGDKISMTFEAPDYELKVEDQINILDAVLAENPDVLCLSAIDMESCQAQIEMAQENGIPVVVFDSNVSDSEMVTAFLATDNIEIGREVAEEIASCMDENGEILIFSAQEKTESIQNRITGFHEVIQNYPDIVVDGIYYEDQVENMEDAMKEALEEFPNARGIVCTNADIADTYLNLPIELRENHLLVGVDATTKQQEAIKNGEEVSCISQDPLTLGYESIITAVYAAMIEEYPEIEIEKETLLTSQKINANNLYNPRYRNFLYTETK